MIKKALNRTFGFQFDKRATLPASRGDLSALRKAFRGGLCLSVTLSLALNTINITNANAYPLTRAQQDWALVAMNHLGDLRSPMLGGIDMAREHL